MWRMIRSHLRHGLGRTVALLLGVGMAATSFAVLTGTAQTSRLAVVGEIEKNFRPPDAGYDLLIRPPGSTTALERDQALVRPNSLAGIPGGITMEQYQDIAALPGVDVAAPIAMIGFVQQQVSISLDLTPYLAESGPEILRIGRTNVTDRGLTRIPDDPIYIYVTDHLRYVDGEGDYDVADLASGPACSAMFSSPVVGASSPPGGRAERWCIARHDGEPPTLYLGLTSTAFVAAIDPEAENELSGLDQAIVQGRPLTAADAPQHPEEQVEGGTISAWIVPALTASPPVVDQQTELTIERLPSSSAGTFRAQDDIVSLDTALHSIPGSLLGSESYDLADEQSALVTVDLTDPADLLKPHQGNNPVGFDLSAYWSASTPDLRQAGPMTVAPVQGAPAITQWLSGTDNDFLLRNPPLVLQEPGFRDLEPHLFDVMSHGGAIPWSQFVGVYDPSKLPELTGLTGATTGLYEAPEAFGADQRSQGLLGGDSLAPDGNPAGYLSAPPTILTTLAALDLFHDPEHFPGTETDAPLSVIRVRVAGVTGPDDVSRERIRVVAEKIKETTGLDVDIVTGASASSVRVDLPAGTFGRPDLVLSEGWSKKGVAFAAVTAQDRKSLVLFGLILVVCALFAANAVTAAVRTRTSELALLSGVGWSRARIFALVLGEVGLVGLVSGGLGTLAAMPLAQLFRLDVPWSQALLAWPAAIVLSLVAGVVPAARAARLTPLAGIRPAARAGRRAVRGRTMTGLARSGIARVPGRTAVGAGALAIAVAATTVLAALIIGFRGQVVGSLLGDAVALQARPGDIFAVVAMIVLALAAVGDVLYLNVRDRMGELGVLQASGWTRWSLARLIGTEALLLGALGAAPGALLGLAASGAFAGELSPTLWWIAAGSACGAVLLSGLVAVVPLLGVLRMRTSQLLAAT